MRYLIIGKSGQLTKEFQMLLGSRGEDFVVLSRKEADVGNYNQLNRVFVSYNPDVVFNCSAYNDVDGAETNYEEAFKVNTIGPYNLALLCERHDALLVHYSTDYVFDGSKSDGLYTEDDKPNPLNKYGLSKLLGERFVLSTCPEVLLFRVSWVFGEGTQNFIHKVLNWAKEKDVLQISMDEVSIPTWARRIAEVSYMAVRSRLRGLYHLTSSGYASRYEWAQEILRLYKINKPIVTVPMNSFNMVASRPKFSAMSNEKIQNELGIEIPNWREELKAFLSTRPFSV